MGKLLQFSQDRRRRPAESSREQVKALINYEPKLISLGSKEEREAAPTFATFVAQLRSQSLATAGETLAFLLGVSQLEGVSAAGVFHERLRAEPGLATQALDIYKYIEGHQPHDSLSLLGFCFGLHGRHAAAVLGHLKTQVS